MDINNEELKKDLEEQYATLEEEIKEDKKKKRYLLVFIFFLAIFLVIFGTSFSYYKLYEENKKEEENIIMKDLYIEGYEESFEFDPKIYTYVISVPYNTLTVELKYVLSSTNYDVEIKGNEYLKTGVNTVEVIIKNSTGDEILKYTIYVTVEENINDSQTSSSEEEINKNLLLKSINVSNHMLDKKFDSNNNYYVVKDIKDTENQILIDFEVVDKSNQIILKLNDAIITRDSKIENDKYLINLNVNTELTLGTNKFEIIVKDNNGNENVYYIFLVVSDSKDNQKVVEISVEYQNDNGNYIISNIIPGWESLEKQHVIVTNSSNYDTTIDIKWTNVDNTFVNTNDLEYFLYKDDILLKTGILPVKDENLIQNLKISANSKNNYYISYRYIYSQNDQNIDQGKTFNAKLKIVLAK